MGAQLLDGSGGAVHNPKGLTPSRAVHLLLMEGAQPLGGQGSLQPLQPLPEGPAENRGIFHRTGDVQRKGYQRVPVLLQQFPLAAGSGLPGLQHLHQSHFPIHSGDLLVLVVDDVPGGLNGGDHRLGLRGME